MSTVVPPAHFEITKCGSKNTKKKPQIFCFKNAGAALTCDYTVIDKNVMQVSSRKVMLKYVHLNVA